MTEHVPEVLFVCVHNAGRSQMAAALLDHVEMPPGQLRTVEPDAEAMCCASAPESAARCC